MAFLLTRCVCPKYLVVHKRVSAFIRRFAPKDSSFTFLRFTNFRCWALGKVSSTDIQQGATE